MDEPPAKRPRRTDGAAPRDKNDMADTRSNPSGRDKTRSQYGEDRDGDRRKRSRSRDHFERRRERSRSREKSYRERDRDRGRGDRTRDVNGGSRREKSQSRDRNRGPRDYRNERSYRRSRSRSPFKPGATTSARTRSPPRRNDHDRARSRERPRAAAAVDGSRSNPKAVSTDNETPLANGDRMAVDEDDGEQLLKKLMGFTTFKTTQNTKVPGNQIYGVRMEKKTEYRQYMNRVGGFNRPLSPSR